MYVPLLPDTEPVAVAAIYKRRVPLPPPIVTVPEVWLIVPEKPFAVELPTFIGEKLLLRFCEMFRMGAVVPLPDTVRDRDAPAADMVTFAPSAAMATGWLTSLGKPLSQFPAVFQSVVEAPPVHMVADCAGDARKAKASARVEVVNSGRREDFFIGVVILRAFCEGVRIRKYLRDDL